MTARSRRLLAGLLLSLVAVLIVAVLSFWWWPQSAAARKPLLRIGYSAFPPYYVVQPDGSPSGFAVSVLAEAARRAGYPVEWTRYAGNPDDAIQRGAIDLFPMMAVLPERRAKVDYSAPWWENALVVVSPAQAPLRTAAGSVGKKISLIHASFGLQRMKSLFPQAIPVTTTDYREVVSNVCTGKVQAAIMESRLANSLQFLDECRGQQLTMTWFSELNLTYGVAVRKGRQALADELFEQIARMSADGTMTRLGQPWGVTTSNQANAVQSMVDAQRSRRFWLAGFAVSAVMLIGLCAMLIQFRKATRVARAALAARSQFIANVSHEIRTPLHGILGTAGLLAESPLSESQQDQLKSIRDCGELLLRQINDLLDMAKLEAGKLATERVPYSPLEIARVTMRLHEALARPKGIELQLSVDGPAAVLGDPHRIQQILNNLVSNALKFTSEGSVHLRIHPAGDRLRFSVRDTGAGLSAATQAKLFRPFEQADNSTARRFGGTGLGLTISRQLVHLMDGEMGLNSEVGLGSEFWFELPLQVAKNVETAAPGELAAPAFRAHVLVAEDNPVNQRIMMAALQKLGCTFLIVENGDAAVEAAGGGAFDLVLMDCHMPNMDGFEATRRIRQLPGLMAKTPIIAVTAAVFEEDTRRARAAGMDDILSKPFTRDQIAVLLARWTATQVDRLAS